MGEIKRIGNAYIYRMSSFMSTLLPHLGSANEILERFLKLDFLSDSAARCWLFVRNQGVRHPGAGRDPGIVRSTITIKRCYAWFPAHAGTSFHHTSYRRTIGLDP